MSEAINKGDLVIVLEKMPNWDWLPYCEGDIGFVVEKLSFFKSMPCVKVYFFKSQKAEAVPEEYLMILEKVDEDR